jgi:hypothetical protein
MGYITVDEVDDEIPHKQVPVCGEDFCDTCGDCLACFGEDKCLFEPDGRHIWVVEKMKGRYE